MSHQLTDLACMITHSSPSRYGRVFFFTSVSDVLVGRRLEGAARAPPHVMCRWCTVSLLWGSRSVCDGLLHEASLYIVKVFPELGISHGAQVFCCAVFSV